jgi:hypothetical protein
VENQENDNFPWKISEFMERFCPKIPLCINMEGFFTHVVGFIYVNKQQLGKKVWNKKIESENWRVATKIEFSFYFIYLVLKLLK